MKTFYIRTLTAVIFVLIMLGGMLWNALSFCILFLIIALAGLWEYFRLIKKINPNYKAEPALQHIIISLLIPSGFLTASGQAFSLFGQPAILFGLQSLLFLLMILLIFAGFGKHPASAFKNLGYSLAVVVYIGLPFSLLVALMCQYSIDGIPILPLAIIFSLWINDTLAYITGSLIGKTPLAPKISPKKTREGTLGGVLLTLIAAGF